MTSKRIAQFNQQHKPKASQESGTLQRAAVRSVSEAGVQSTDDLEAQPLGNSAFSKDFSRVPISTTKPQQIMAKLMIGEPGDKYEQEADETARQVVQRIHQPQSEKFQRESLSEEEDELQMKLEGSIQKESLPEEEDELQMKPMLQRSPLPYQQLTQHPATETPSASARDLPLQAKGDKTGNRPDSSVEQRSNKTGMPDALKAGVESLSGYSLDDVRVHYNSPKPAQLQALAYTQGTEIHVASGQEEHLPHEAWHVVQQAQSRVQPTMQMKDGVPINDDAGLEREADVVGGRVTHMSGLDGVQNGRPDPEPGPVASPAGNVAQLTRANLNAANDIWQTYNNTHGTVNGIVTGDIARLQAAYAHYSLPANGGLNDAAADAANPFLKNSVKGLLHDVEEIDSHSGGYYFQQVVKDSKNAAVDVINQTGAHGGATNASEPDLTVQQGVGGNKDAIEAKRTTTPNGAFSMLSSALNQLSLKRGYANASAFIEVTHPTQSAYIIANRGVFDNFIIAQVDTFKGLGEKYWHSTQAMPGGLQHRFRLTVSIRSSVLGVAAAVIYDRDFNVIIEETVGRRGPTYPLIGPILSTIRV